MTESGWGKVIAAGHRRAWIAALLALPTVPGACADHVQSSVVACPCSQGICCDSGVCAADQNACGQATAALSNDSAGHWTGYVENYAFASGSSALDLTLQVAADESLSGQIILGQGTPPAPPTDGTVGWPAGIYSFGNVFNQISPIEGFGYHVKNVKWTALRLQFEIDTAEPWGAWCRLQTSYQDTQDPASWSCSPSNGGEFTPDACYLNTTAPPPMQADCSWLYLCGGTVICSCTATGCDAGTQLGFQFDVALRNNAGDGSIQERDRGPSGQAPQAHNVRLIRASN